MEVILTAAEVAVGHKLAADVEDAEEFVEPVGLAAHQWLLKYKVESAKSPRINGNMKITDKPPIFKSLN